MKITFQTLCSSSSGNCVTLCSDTTRLVVDCGLSSMKRTRAALADLHRTVPIRGVLLTHIHGDHISYYPLRVLEQMQVPVRVHEACVQPLRERHFNGYGFGDLQIAPFADSAFEIGDFRIRPFPVVHHPWYATVGYEIYHGDKKIVIATDFCRWDNLVDRFADADFVFVESNHDLELLRRYFNPNSRYHLPNPQTAALLMAAGAQSKRPPRTVMLGHLSSQRNTPRLALRETTQAFAEAGVPMDFDLLAAPLKEPGVPVRI